MSDTYGFRLSRQDLQLYTAWSRLEPPDEWEIERNRRIAAIRGSASAWRLVSVGPIVTGIIGLKRAHDSG